MKSKVGKGLAVVLTIGLVFTSLTFAANPLKAFDELSEEPTTQIIEETTDNSIETEPTEEKEEIIIEEKVPQEEAAVDNSQDQAEAVTGNITLYAKRTAKVTEVTISGSNSVEKYANTQLTLTITPSGASGVVSWISSDKSILTVDGNGKVTGVAEGSADVYAIVKNAGDDEVVRSNTLHITVKAPTKTAISKFFYLKTPTSNPASNDTSQWGRDIGNGRAVISGDGWQGINLFISSEPGRVVSWPGGFEGGNVSNDDDWHTIFSAYKNSLGESEVQESDVESITLQPYKISNNNDGYHVDCTVKIVLKEKKYVTATYWLQDVGDTTYVWKYAENKCPEQTTSPSRELMNLPATKTVENKKYKLEAWYDGSGSSVTFPYTVTQEYDALNFYAKYVDVTDYKVTYDLKGGTWTRSNTENHKAGTIVAVTSKVPTKAGYEFDGWEIPEGITVSDGHFEMPANNITFNAKWKANKYTVTWVNYDDTELEKDENVEYGEMPSYDGETPTREATAQYTYTFKEWTPEISPVTGDITYKATYDRAVNKYTVTYNLNGGSSAEQLDYPGLHYGAPTPTINAPTRAGYTFAGWSPAVENTVKGDAEYVAQWTPIQVSVIIHYVDKDGNTVADDYTDTVEYGDNISQDSPLPEGYELVNEEDRTVIKENITEDFEYTVVYKKIPIPIPTPDPDNPKVKPDKGWFGMGDGIVQTGDMGVPEIAALAGLGALILALLIFFYGRKRKER